MSNSSSGEGATLWLLAIALTLILVIYVSAFLVPFVLLVGSILYFTKAQNLKEKVSGHISDYWLKNNEKREYKISLETYKEAERLINDVEKKGEKEGLSRNKDGSFSRRSKLGKEINDTIEKNVPILKKNMSKALLYEILPLKRWEKEAKKLNSYIVKSRAFIFSLILLTIYFILTGLNNDWRLQLDLISALLIIVFPAIVYVIIKGLNKNPSKDYVSEKPPRVSLKNVDDYEATHNFKKGSFERI